MTARAKRQVLLYCADVDRLAVTRFVLETRGFRANCGFAVTPCGSLDSVQAALAEGADYDAACVVETDGFDAGIWPVLQASRVPVLQVARYGVRMGNPVARVTLSCEASPAAIVERLRVLATRKRGPQPARVAAWCGAAEVVAC